MHRPHRSPSGRAAELPKSRQTCSKWCERGAIKGGNNLSDGHDLQRAAVKYNGIHRYISRIQCDDSLTAVVAGQGQSAASQHHRSEALFTMCVLFAPPLVDCRGNGFRILGSRKTPMVIEGVVKFLPGGPAATRRASKEPIGQLAW